MAFCRRLFLLLGVAVLRASFAASIASDVSRDRLLVAEVGNSSYVHHTTPCDTAVVGPHGCQTGPNGFDVPALYVDDFPFFKSPYTTYPTDGSPWAISLIGPYPDGTTYLVNWESGTPKVGAPTSFTTPSHVVSRIKLSTTKGAAAASGKIVNGVFVTYERSFTRSSGQWYNTYKSPVLNHVVLKGLKPLTTYFYIVGNGTLWSSERNFTTLATHKTAASKRYPLRIGLIGDVGQTNNSTQTLAHILVNQPQVVLNVGDYSYADNYGANNPNDQHNRRNGTSQHGDTMGVMWDPLFSHVAHLGCAGNHEIEDALINATAGSAVTQFPYPSNYPFQSYAARYPVAGTTADFGNINNNLYYSTIEGGVVKLLVLNNYMPFQVGSVQYSWFVKELEGFDRRAQPWLFVMVHASMYHTYNAHYKEIKCFLSIYEDLFYEYGVDLVLSGHVHAYERTHPTYKFKVDTCAPVYVTIGDGGNIEGPYRNFVDEINPATNKSYCEQLRSSGKTPNDIMAGGGGSMPVGWPPTYQREWHVSSCPTTSWQPASGSAGGPALNLLNSTFTNSSVPLGFCQSSQPVWSAYRDASFGHGILELLSDSVMKLSWYRNLDGVADAVDGVTLEGLSGCGSEKRRRQSRKQK